LEKKMAGEVGVDGDLPHKKRNLVQNKFEDLIFNRI
jgi:hypothetical protein